MDKKSPEKRSALHILTGTGRYLVMAFVPVSYTHLDVYKRQVLGCVLCNLSTAAYLSERKRALTGTLQNRGPYRKTGPGRRGQAEP